MFNLRRWLKQGTVIGSGPLRFKVTGAFWVIIGSAILIMLFQSLWTWTIVFGVIAIVVGIAVTRERRKL